MKILERIDYSKWKLPFTCVKCETKLEAEPGDVQAVYHEGSGCDPREYYAAYYSYSVECPVCKTQKSLNERDFPATLRIDVQNRAKKY